MKVQYGSSFEEEGYLDDGDLPSLTPKGSGSFGSHNAASRNGNPPGGPSSRRQFWDQLDDSSGPKEVTATSNNRSSRYGNGNRNHIDDDGPDDEMAARRALIVPAETKNVRSFESENSAPTENESQLTEEIEEEPYETSICGQTLNAIDDMCGGNLNLTGDRPDRSNKRRSTTSPPVDRHRHGAHSPPSSSPRSPNIVSETQQENTAIEVEFVEPIQSTKSTDSQGGASDSQKKNLRLNAIAKKAKENFRNKMGRKAQTPKSTVIHATASGGSSVEPPVGEVAAAPERIESPVVDDAVIVSAAVVPENTPASVDVDQDYNTFNATEKRKFIKLINSGVSSTVATRQILEDRLQSQVTENEPVTVPTNVDNDVDAYSFDREMDEEDEDMAPKECLVSGQSDVSDGGDSLPFLKSGSIYYDAVRKDVEDDQDIIEISSRGSSGFKALEFGVVQRFFQAGKPKGFAALPDTPDRRAISAPSQRLMEEEGYTPLESSRGSDILESEIAGSLVVSNSVDRQADETLADFVKNNSFDSLIRQRLAHSPEEMSMGTTGNETSIEGAVNQVVTEPVTSRDIPSLETQSLDDQISEPAASSLPVSSPPFLQRNKSVDSALNSTMESYSTAHVDPSANHNDAMSVYTTGTSVATGATSLTQSSRVRRPGVAKVRLAKQKEIEQASTKKRQGWHETIRVAAESTNRTWDPNKGWVDYEEPDTVATDFDSKREPIKIDLSRSVLSHKDIDSNDKSGDQSVPAAPVPFPEEWEKEREAMIRASPEVAARTGPQVPVENMLLGSEPPRDVDGENVVLDVSQLSRSLEKESIDESQANGWVESMRAASAALAKEGMTWDPNYGWQRTGGDASAAQETGSRQIANDVEIDGEIPDTVDFDAPVAVSEEPLVFMPTENVDSVATPTVMNDSLVSSKIVPVTTKDVAQKTRRWFGRKVTSEPTNDAAILGVESGLFLTKDNVNFDAEEKDGSDPFDSNVNGLPDDIVILETGSDGESNRNVIEVVKLKVDDTDIELFPRMAASPNHADSSLKAHPAPWNSIRTVASMETHQANISVLSNDRSSVSSRRGAGPVDTDEVDETWDSDDEERRSRGWLPEVPEPMKRDASLERHHIDSWKDGALNAPRVDSTAISSPHLSDTGRSTGSRTPGSSDASPSKRIPKLQRSKRDTSPLSLRSNLDVAFPRSAESIQRHEEAVDTEQPSQVADSKPKDAAPNGSTEVPIVAAIKRPDPVSPNSNLVKARLKEWESRIESSHSTDAGDAAEVPRPSGIVPSVVAGWKSFLSKKVEKETAVPSTKEFPTAVKEKTLQPVPLTRGKPSEDDTLFQFGDKPEVAALNLSDLSPIRANVSDDDDDDVATSVAYGPTEAQRKSASFLERLTECATPMMPTRPMCGGRVEDDTVTNIDEADKNALESETHRRSQSFGDEQPQSLSTSAVKAVRTSSSSVISEDFGAKTAFLDALAMKAAVSKPKRARRSDGGGSSVVSGGTDHSEQWQKFLERKKAAGGSPITSRVSDAQLSQAAEKYASEKVEEIISKMSARSNTAPRSRDVVRSSSIGDRAPDQPRSISAAEDLAAARVEAMMAALSSSSHMDEGEI